MVRSALLLALATSPALAADDVHPCAGWDGLVESVRGDSPEIVHALVGTTCILAVADAADRSGEAEGSVQLVVIDGPEALGSLALPAGLVEGLARMAIGDTERTVTARELGPIGRAGALAIRTGRIAFSAAAEVVARAESMAEDVLVVEDIDVDSLEVQEIPVAAVDDPEAEVDLHPRVTVAIKRVADDEIDLLEPIFGEPAAVAAADEAAADEAVVEAAEPDPARRPPGVLLPAAAAEGSVSEQVAMTVDGRLESAIGLTGEHVPANLVYDLGAVRGLSGMELVTDAGHKRPKRVALEAWDGREWNAIASLELPEGGGADCGDDESSFGGADCGEQSSHGYAHIAGAETRARWVRVRLEESWAEEKAQDYLLVKEVRFFGT